MCFGLQICVEQQSDVRRERANNHCSELPKGQNNITLNFDDLANEVAKSKENSFTYDDILSFAVEDNAYVSLQREGMEWPANVWPRI